MQFSWTILVIVLLLGVLQLAVGVVLGRCLPTGSSKSTLPEDGDDLPDSELPEAAELAAICDDLKHRLAEVTEEP